MFTDNDYYHTFTDIDFIVGDAEKVAIFVRRNKQKGGFTHCRMNLYFFVIIRII